MKVKELLNEFREATTKNKEKQEDDLFVVGGGSASDIKRSQYHGFEKPMTKEEKETARSRRKNIDAKIDKKVEIEKKEKKEFDDLIEKLNKKLLPIQSRFDNYMKNPDMYSKGIESFIEILDNLYDMRQNVSYSLKPEAAGFIKKYVKNNFEAEIRKLSKEIEKSNSKSLSQKTFEYIMDRYTKFLTPGIKGSINMILKLLKNT